MASPATVECLITKDGRAASKPASFRDLENPMTDIESMPSSNKLDEGLMSAAARPSLVDRRPMIFLVDAGSTSEAYYLAVESRCKSSIGVLANSDFKLLSSTLLLADNGISETGTKYVGTIYPGNLSSHFCRIVATCALNLSSCNIWRFTAFVLRLDQDKNDTS